MVVTSSSNPLCIPYSNVGTYRCIDIGQCPRGGVFYTALGQIPTIPPPNPGVGIVIDRCISATRGDTHDIVYYKYHLQEDKVSKAVSELLKCHNIGLATVLSDMTELDISECHTIILILQSCQ